MKDFRRVALAHAAAAGAMLAGAAGSASAQDSIVVTYREAVQLALTQSSTIERALNDVALSRLSVSGARTSFLPDLRLSVSGDQSYGRSFSQNEGAIINETNESMSARVSSSVTLFDGLANVSELQAARLGAEAASLDLERTQQTVVFEVISGFLEVIAAEEQVTVQQQNLDALVQQEAQIETLVRGGSRPVSDLYQQQANVAAARVSVVEARRARELARVDLVQTLRLDPALEYRFEAPSLPDTIVTSESRPFDALLAVAFANRSDIAAAERQVAAAGEQVDVAQAGWWPSVSLSAGYGSAYTTASDLGFSDQFDQRRGGSIGLGVSVPLFDRGSVSRATQQAEIQQENARLTLEDLRRSVAIEVRRALLDRDAAIERLAAADARLIAAQRALTATQQRYDAGVATLLEVTQARANLVAASSERVNARYTLLFQEQLLQYYAGELEPDSGLGA